jgi:hypothetical protein
MASTTKLTSEAAASSFAPDGGFTGLIDIQPP